jgi:putative phosphoserine phosphatase/1-acylglycerol-3-phosphate O-acyltransferase
VRFLAKREMFDLPVVGWLVKAIGGIPVDRGSGSGEPLRAAEASLRAGEVVVVLPEGTIPRGEAAFDPQLHGHTGAARLAAATGAPVVPIGLWGTDGVWPRSSTVPNVVGVHSVSARVGPTVPLGLADAVADTETIMSAIAALLPEEARTRRAPTPEELAKTYPRGR